MPASPSRTVDDVGVELVDLNQFDLSPTNPRKDAGNISELADSLRSGPLLHAVTARRKGKRFELVCGWRRWLAAREAGLTAIPTKVLELTDEEAEDLQLVENVGRKDIHPMEEAETYRRMATARGPHLPEVPTEEIAARVHRAVRHVRERLLLCRLVKPAQEAFAGGKLPLFAAMRLARVPEPKDQAELLKKLLALGEEYSEREVREVFDCHHLVLKQAPFKLDDATLTKAGACLACPHHTGSQLLLLDDGAAEDRCVKPSCYDEKVRADTARKFATAEEAGLKVLSAAESKEVFPKWNGGGVDYASKYVELDAATKKKLGAKADEVKVLARDADGLARELVPKSALPKSAPPAPQRLSPSEKAHATKQKEMKGQRKRRQALLPIAVVPALVAAAEEFHPRDLLRLVIELHLGEGTFAYSHVAERREFGTTKKLRAQLELLDDGQIQGVVLELAVDAQPHSMPYDGKWPERVQAAADFLGVDLGKLEREYQPPAPKAPPPVTAKGKRAAKAGTHASRSHPQD